MFLLNPSLSFLHDIYCRFSSQKYSYCISYILHVVWLSVITIRLSIHRWQHNLCSLSAYESPSNGQDQVLSVLRIPYNPALQYGCYLDCFQRPCRDIAGSGKTDNFLFLVIIMIMVLFQEWGVYLIHSCFSYLYHEPITPERATPSHSKAFSRISLFLYRFPTNFEYQISLTSQSSKTKTRKMYLRCFQRLHLLFVIIVLWMRTHTEQCFLFRWKIDPKHILICELQAPGYRLLLVYSSC